MHPTGRDCFGPPTLNRFWTCLCQRIDPKRGVARRGRAFIPDHSGLRAPFSADVRTRARPCPRRRPRAPRHSSQTLACRACRASRRTTRTVSAIPPRFRLSPRLRFRVSGRSRIAAARRPDVGDWFGAVDVRSGALGGLTDASTAYIDPANTAAPRAARAYTARYTAASTPRPRAPGCAARRHSHTHLLARRGEAHARYFRGIGTRLVHTQRPCIPYTSSAPHILPSAPHVCLAWHTGALPQAQRSSFKLVLRPLTRAAVCEPNAASCCHSTSARHWVLHRIELCSSLPHVYAHSIRPRTCRQHLIFLRTPLGRRLVASQL